jgi:hypothetical protein
MPPIKLSAPTVSQMSAEVVKRFSAEICSSPSIRHLARIHY